MKATKSMIQLSLLIIAGLLATLTSALADYQSTIQSQSPVGYWRLNDSVSAPAPILATNLGSLGALGNAEYRNDITLGASGALPSQPGDGAVSCYESVDRARVRVPFNTTWNTNSSFSVEFWAKPRINSGGSIYCPAASTLFSTARTGWLFYQGNSALTSPNGWVFRLYRTGSATAVGATVNMSLDTNSWYHVVGVYNQTATPGGTNIVLYVNGVPVSTNSVFATPYAPIPAASNTVSMAFGARSDGASGYFGYAGSIDEPAFYSSALSDAQVAAHYSAGTNASPGTPYQTVIASDSPAGYWRLNETYGPAAANLGSSAASGNYSDNSVPGASGPSAPSFPGFEATNKSVTISTNGSVRCRPLNLNTNTVTMTAWIKPNGAQTAYNGIVFQWANVPALTYSGLMVGKDGGLQLGYDWNADPVAEEWASPITLTDNQWQFVALSVSPDQAVLCAHDGTTFQVGTNVALHSVQGFQGVTHIGRDFFANAGFNGDIDEVAVFNRSLNLGELYTLYAAAKDAVPPQIFTEPVGPAAIYTSETLSLSVIAGGTPDLIYQWRTNSTAIAGATNSAYSRLNMTTNGNGSYDVVIANAFGSVTSAPVVITVLPQFAPTITSQPVGASVYQNGYVNLQVGADGGNLRYRWYQNGSPVPAGSNASYVISPAQGTNAGNYYVVVSNTISAVTSVTVPVTVTVPATNSYEAKIVADSPVSWWRLDEASGSTFADAMGRNPGTWVTAPTLGAPGALAGNTNTAAEFVLATASYGTVPFAAALNSDTISVECWVKTSEIENDIVPVSSWAASPDRKGYMFTASAGQWRSAFSFGNDFAYTYISAGNISAGQWSHLVYTHSPGAGWSVYLNGVRNGAFNASGWVRNTIEPFRIGTDVPGSASYNNFFDGLIDEVAVYGTVLSASNVVAHYEAGRFGAAGSAPVVTVQPPSQSVAEGLNATFTPTVIGSSPIFYQWSKNISPIAGATNLSLTLPGITFASAGNYTLTATNAFGSTNSQIAVLTVVGQPTFANSTNNLVLHLKFDGSYSDSTGRGNNGTNVGSTAIVAGKVGSGALSYSTTTNPFVANYVDLGVRPDLQFGASTDFTVAFWIKFTGTPNDLPFFCNSDTSSGSPGYTFAPGFGDGNFDWSLNSYRYNGALAINDGNWRHVLVSITRTGNAVTYLDGLAVDTRLGTAVDLDTGFNTVIGQGCFFDYAEAGSFQMDDLGVWRRALTGNEAYNVWYVGQNYSRSFDNYGPVVLELRRNVSGIQLIWQAGTLEEADSVLGPWTNVSGAAAPSYEVGTSSPTKFYRVKL